MNATVLGMLWVLGNAGQLPTPSISEYRPTRDRDGLVVQMVARYVQAGLVGGLVSYDRRLHHRPLWIRPMLGYAGRFAARHHGEKHIDNTLLLGCGVAYGDRFRATADGLVAVGPRDHFSIDGIALARHWGTDVSASVGGEFMARTGFMIRLSVGVSYFPNLPPFSDHRTWNPITLLHLGTKF